MQVYEGLRGTQRVGSEQTARRLNLQSSCRSTGRPMNAEKWFIRQMRTYA
jgi:hypothetical protein